MKPRLTRRAAAKILLAVPAALAAAPLACTTVGGSDAAPPLTPEQQKEKQDLARSVSRLEGCVQKVDAVEIPIGAEPAFAFSPLVAAKK